MKHALCLLLAALLALTLLPGAAEEAPGGGSPNWYEIFVRSYQDSDGDGLGDLNGLRARLDYIQDMGWTGLWLMPVMPSPSSHQYDVTDYCAVDPAYGTLEDLKALAADCHSRGIQLILDLPLNHTSTEHPWFKAACAALLSGGESPYTGYYHFRQEGGSGYVPLGDSGWYYEEQFAGGGMPDLNLDSEAVLAEIEAVLRFWLIDCDVDGFRLDAVTSYWTNDTERNVAFLRWLKERCEAIRPGSYLVGECWAGLTTVADYYASGVDSFFLFPAAQAEGFIAKALRGRRPASTFVAALLQHEAAIPDGLLAPFTANHDTGRTVGLVQGRSAPERLKLAFGLLGILPGRTFFYYGDEVGLAGSANDPDKRIAMPWNDEDMCDQPPGITEAEYPFPGVDAQLQDEGSILRYVQRVNQMRLTCPALWQGRSEAVQAEAQWFLLRRRAPSGESCLIAANLSAKAVQTVPTEASAILFDLETGADSASLADGQLTLPPYAIVILSE